MYLLRGYNSLYAYIVYNINMYSIISITVIVLTIDFHLSVYIIDLYLFIFLNY